MSRKSCAVLEDLTPEEQSQAILDMLHGHEPFDHHFHRCPDCSHIWDHTASKIYEDDISECAFDRAHSCPECGAGKCCYKYFTLREAEKDKPGSGRARDFEPWPRQKAA